MKTLIMGLIAATTVATALPAAAQVVDQREHRQDARIDAGVRQGQLNPREAYRVDRREMAIHRQEHRMRARHDGRLTQHDRHVLNHRLNRESRQIERLRHNGR